MGATIWSGRLAMSVLNIFSPGWFSGGTSVTQFVANPWGTAAAPATDVWVQCTMSAFEDSGSDVSLLGWGIIEVESLDANGQLHRQQFGNPSDLANVYFMNLPQRLFVPRMLTVTLAFIAYGMSGAPTVTLFQWG
jgi:hypothetical protein